MSSEEVGLELDAARMRALLVELDGRLRRRGIAASIYLVGGAAMALEYGRETLTADIDALFSHAAVREEARNLADRHGLPESWLNSNAAGWVPPRPSWAASRPSTPGLTVHVAPAEHLLAMKLVALRRKDRPDIGLLIERLDMAQAAPEDYASLLCRVYGDAETLAQALGVAGSDEAAVRREALAIGEWAREFAERLRRDR